MVLTEHPVRLPLRVARPDLPHRELVLLRGPSGWGEWSPLPGHACDPGTARVAAEEAACGDWPGPVRESVPVNALIPAADPPVAGEAAAAAVAAGFRSVKVKVGDRGDLARVAAVRDAVGGSVAIRVDANRRWDLQTATDRLRRLTRYRLELAEDPVASLADLARLRRRVPVPLAADELVRSLADARQLAALDAADVVVVKVQPVGGFRAARQIAEAARCTVVVSSMLESSVGLSAGLAFAASLPELPLACGLGTAALLGADVTADPLVPVDGALTVRRVEPDPELLERYGAA